jgi:hypothetical protein
MTYGAKSWREWVLEEDESRPFLRRALELGINFFDTADMYSAGASEEILGRAIEDFARHAQHALQVFQRHNHSIVLELNRAFVNADDLELLSRAQLDRIANCLFQFCRQLLAEHCRILVAGFQRPAAVMKLESGEHRTTLRQPAARQHAGRAFFVGTDELWRWRFRTGDAFYGRYWVHVIRYLSRSKLLGKDAGAELSVDHKLYRTGENVVFRVRFADERLTPTATDGVTVVVERSGGEQKKVVLTRIPEASLVFEGQLPQAPEGKYHAWVSAPSFARAPPAEDFEVRRSERETRVLRTDLGELGHAAQMTGGKIYTLQTAERLVNDIPAGLPVPIDTNLDIRLWKHWLTLSLFAGFICSEWILRKRWRLL